MPRIKNQFLKPRTPLLKMIKSWLSWSKKYELPFAEHVSKKTVIFDLGGVLFKSNTTAVFHAIGWSTILRYIIQKWKIPHEKAIYRSLAAIPAQSKQLAFVADKHRMPAIIVDWQCGLQTLEQLKTTMIDHIQNSAHTTIEKEFLIKVIEFKLTPEKLIATRSIIKGALELLDELKNKGYQLYIISNWDPYSFSLLKKHFPQIFTYQNKARFNGIMTSGKVGTLKPHHSIFEKALQEFNLTASTAIFIDDIIENLHSAEKIGLATIHCRNKNLKSVKMHLFHMLKS